MTTELDPTAKYTFICYQPSKNVGRGCHCHTKYTYHESEFERAQGLTQDELVRHLIDAKRSEHFDEMDIRFFDEKFPSEVFEGSSDEEHEACMTYTAHRELLEKTIWDLVYASVPIVKAKREAEERERAAKEAEKERIRKAKWEEEERERRDRETYARLAAKFQPKEKS